MICYYYFSLLYRSLSSSDTQSLHLLSLLSHKVMFTTCLHWALLFLSPQEETVIYLDHQDILLSQYISISSLIKHRTTLLLPLFSHKFKASAHTYIAVVEKTSVPSSCLAYRIIFSLSLSLLHSLCNLSHQPLTLDVFSHFKTVFLSLPLRNSCCAIGTSWSGLEVSILMPIIKQLLLLEWLVNEWH